MEQKKRKKNAKALGKIGFLQSIKGKIWIMGGTAIAASAILGVVGVNSLNKNSDNNDVLTELNHINLYQYENQSLDTSYLYFLEDSYLESIVENLGSMEQSAAQANKLSGRAAGEKIAEMEDVIAECKSNYTSIREIAGERGYTADAGAYQEFFASDEQLTSDFRTFADDKSWLDGRWVDIAPAAEQTEEYGCQDWHMLLPFLYWLFGSVCGADCCGGGCFFAGGRNGGCGSKKRVWKMGGNGRFWAKCGKMGGKRCFSGRFCVKIGFVNA